MPTSAPGSETRCVIDRFNAAFLAHDPAALVPLVAPDCVLENTVPAPDGARCIGQAECLALWQSIAADRTGRFELEDVEVHGERAIIRWRYWLGAANSVRGVNLMRVVDGRIVEGMGYVKGAAA